MASTGEVWRLGRRPALDGIRGVAVLLVVAHHAGVLGFPDAAGVVGVTVFFTLSGFLITALLLRELEGTGRVRLRAFYARRARRLVPALAAFLAVMVGLGLATPSSATWAALYASNWLAAAGYASTELAGLTHTWSLATEEQFYLVWPLVLVIAAARIGRRGLGTVAGVGACLSLVLRVALWHGGAGADRVYFGADTRADALLLGCLLAVLLEKRATEALPGVAAAAMLGLAALVATPTLFAQYVIVPTAAALLTCLVIATTRGGWAEAKWLTLVGQRSYAVYLWHFPLIFLVLPRLALPHPVGLVVVLAATWVAALVSWRYFEEPILRRGLDRGETHRVEAHVSVGSRGVHAY